VPIWVLPRYDGVYAVFDFASARRLGAYDVPGINMYSICSEKVRHYLAYALELLANRHSTGPRSLCNMTRTAGTVVDVERLCQSVHNFRRRFPEPLMAKIVDQQQVGDAEGNLILLAIPEKPAATAFFANRAPPRYIGVLMDEDESHEAASARAQFAHRNLSAIQDDFEVATRAILWTLWAAGTSSIDFRLFLLTRYPPICCRRRSIEFP
jgi:hypothetical protein